MTQEDIVGEHSLRDARLIHLYDEHVVLRRIAEQRVKVPCDIEISVLNLNYCCVLREWCQY